MTRWKASGIHLTLCVFIALTVISTMLFIWYPAPLFQAMGGHKIVMMIIVIDVVVGPLLTLIIYRPMKKGLKFDLTVIAILQLIALIYGVSVLFQGRPVFMVFVKDRIDIVTALDIDPESLAKVKNEKYKRLPLTGPELVAAKTPDDPKERERILISAIDKGRDLQSFPEYYQPFENQRDRILKRSMPLSDLQKKRPESETLISELIEEYGESGSELVFLPVVTPKYNDLTAVIDPSKGTIVEFLKVDPWL